MAEKTPPPHLPPLAVFPCRHTCRKWAMSNLIPTTHSKPGRVSIIQWGHPGSYSRPTQDAVPCSHRRNRRDPLSMKTEQRWLYVFPCRLGRHYCILPVIKQYNVPPRGYLLYFARFRAIDAIPSDSVPDLHHALALHKRNSIGSNSSP